MCSQAFNTFLYTKFHYILKLKRTPLNKIVTVIQYTYLYYAQYISNHNIPYLRSSRINLLNHPIPRKKQEICLKTTAFYKFCSLILVLLTLLPKMLFFVYCFNMLDGTVRLGTLLFTLHGNVA